MNIQIHGNNSSSSSSSSSSCSCSCSRRGGNDSNSSNTNTSTNKKDCWRGFEHLTREEMDRAIDSLKNYKAVDEGGLVAEMLKGAGVDSILREELFILLSFVWNTGVCLSSWCSAVIVPLFKKGDPSIMNNYRGIALQDIVEKVFAIILLKRLEPIVESQIYEGQYGFRHNKSTIDAIYNIRKIIESSREYKKPPLFFFCRYY